MTLEELLKKHSGSENVIAAENPVLDEDGYPENWLTEEGAEAYSKLVGILYDTFEYLLGVSNGNYKEAESYMNVDDIITALDLEVEGFGNNLTDKTLSWPDPHEALDVKVDQ